MELNQEFKQSDLEDQVQSLDFSQLGVLKAIPKPSLGYHGPDEVVNHLRSRIDITKVDPANLSVNGIAIQDDMEVYLKNPGVSSSLCKEYQKTPLHGFWAEHKPFKQKPKKHFEFGTFAHMAFLEPKMFEMVIVEPPANMASNEGCDKLITFYTNLVLDAFSKGHINKVFYNAVFPGSQDLSKIAGKKARIEELVKWCPYTIIEDDHKAIIDILHKNYVMYGGGIIPEIMKGAISETSFYATDPETSLAVKVRPDALNLKENVGTDTIISFKTTACENIERFFYDTASLGYHLSEGMYQDVISHVSGREFKTTITIMLQSVPPYLPAVLWWDADDLENGKYKYRNALQTIKSCREKNYYPGFDAMAEENHFGIIKMNLPEWSKKEMLPVTI
jgi:hypothetical protein